MSLLPCLFLAIAAFLFQDALAQKGVSCNCGWINKGRVVGGKTAQKNQFPWLAGLWAHDHVKVVCGATIISKYHAITAAHCEPYLYMTNLFLVPGLHDTGKLIYNRDSDAIKIGIERIVVHPDYSKRGNVSDDIALVVTRTEIPFSTNVGPACLPTGPINLDNQKVIGMGWGQEGFYQGQPSQLKYVDLTVIPHEECKKYWDTLIEPQVQLCGLQKNDGLCMGDSGGPLVWLDSETRRYTIVGVASYVQGCKFPPPTVFTEVGKYIPWLKQTIQETKPEPVCSKQ